MNKTQNEKVYVDAEIVDDEFKAPILKDIIYPVSEDSLKALVERYKDVKEIDLEADEESIGAEYQKVLVGYKEFVKERNKIERTRKAIKDPAFSFGKSVDAFAKKLQAIIQDTEVKLKIQKDRVEQNEARKQAEAEEREETRIDEIKTKIKHYKELPLQFLNSSSSEILEFLVNSKNPTPTDFEEFFEEAVNVFTNSHSQLRQMSDSKILVENAQRLQDEADAKAREEKAIEDKKLQDDKDALAKEQAEFQKQKADFERQQREQQEVIDRQEAERVADKLMAKQEADRKEKSKQDKLILKDAKAKTRSMIIDFDDKDGFNYDDFIEAVINNEIPNIKWEM